MREIYDFQVYGDYAMKFALMLFIHSLKKINSINY